MRQVNKVRGRITDGKLFPQISTLIETDMEDLIKDAFTKIWSDVRRVLYDIKADLNVLVDENSYDIDDYEEFRDELKVDMIQFGDEAEELKGLISSLDKVHEA